MASLGDKRGAYSIDYTDIRHREATVRTIVNSETYENMLKNLEGYYEYDIAYVPKGYEHRPDLISNVFYGTPKNWYLLMLVNNITDPFEGFRINEQIKIPKLS